MSKIIQEKNHKKAAFWAGFLILAAYGVLGSEFTDSKVAGMLWESLSGLAVIGIALIMYPYLRLFGENLSRSYLLLKWGEGLIMVIAGILILFLTDKIELIRDWMYNVHTAVFLISAFFFYVLLHRAKLVPSFLTISGMIAVVPVLIGNILEVIGVDSTLVGIFFIPIILNEVALALWLMMKGFKYNENKM